MTRNRKMDCVPMYLFLLKLQRNSFSVGGTVEQYSSLVSKNVTNSYVGRSRRKWLQQHQFLENSHWSQVFSYYKQVTSRNLSFFFVNKQGAGSGIGRATCKILSRDGATIIAVDQNGAAAAETAKILGNGIILHYRLTPL